MISGKGLASVVLWISGEQALLAMAQANFLSNLERINKTRTHTYLSYNAQTEFGVSRNFGADRYYCWDDTMIDCRNAPTLADSDALAHMQETLEENPKFQKFKQSIEDRTGGFITVEPFISVQRGEENMRYNLRRGGKIDDFDIIRVGLRAQARDECTFHAGLKTLENSDCPFKINIPCPHAKVLETA